MALRIKYLSVVSGRVSSRMNKQAHMAVNPIIQGAEIPATALAIIVPDNVLEPSLDVVFEHRSDDLRRG